MNMTLVDHNIPFALVKLYGTMPKDIGVSWSGIFAVAWPSWVFFDDDPSFTDFLLALGAFGILFRFAKAFFLPNRPFVEDVTEEKN